MGIKSVQEYIQTKHNDLVFENRIDQDVLFFVNKLAENHEVVINCYDDIIKDINMSKVNSQAYKNRMKAEIDDIVLNINNRMES